MLRCVTALIGATLCLAFATLGLSQVDSDLLKGIPQAPAKIVKLDNDGTVSNASDLSQYLPLLHLPARVDEITLLKKEWVQEELKLTPHQRRHYREAFDKFLKKRAAVPEGLTDLLDEKQLERFRELLVRCRIRVLGIHEFFRQPALGLSKEEFSAIEELIEKLEPEYAKTITELRDKTLDDLQNPLTDEQREQLKTISAGFLEERAPPLELLFWQLKNIDRYEETIADKDYRELRGLFTRFFFRIDFDGLLEEETYIFPVFDPKSTDPLYEEESILLAGVFGSMFGLFIDPSSVEELQFTDEQITAARQLSAEFGRMETEWHRKVTRGKPGYSDYLKWKKNFLTEGVRQFEDLFLPHQKRLLKTMSMLLEILRAGTASALIYGEAGRNLKLSSDQKSDVKEISAMCMAEIESKAKKWEEEIFKKLKSCLQDDTRQRLDIVFSESPSFGFSDLNLLLRRER